MVAPIINELSTEECMHLLGSVPVGRVGLSIGALPVVLPVNFTVVDGDIVFRTVEGTKFHAAANGVVLAFEADGYAPDGTSGWSVLVQGVSSVVTESTELNQVRESSLEPWAFDGTADRVLRIMSTRVSGRRFARSNP
jgi:nitroimidazol reductase NimA-like FMN-containing flavoprotein (pyridoxamine 5'-phosphate oxidase superfamily)